MWQFDRPQGWPGNICRPVTYVAWAHEGDLVTPSHTGHIRVDRSHKASTGQGRVVNCDAPWIM